MYRNGVPPPPGRTRKKEKMEKSYNAIKRLENTDEKRHRSRTMLRRGERKVGIMKKMKTESEKIAEKSADSSCAFYVGCC